MLSQQPENRPLQYFLSQRSQPLEPDEEELQNSSNNQKYSLTEKENPLLEQKYNYLPTFPSNLEEFIKENKINSVKSSSRNTGRILLPNPYPKKNSNRSSFANEEIGENKRNEEKLEENSEKNKNSRKTSFSVEEFKEYNKKFQGKKLSERLDIISNEYESKVLGDLKKIEEKISEVKPTNLVIVKTQMTPKNNHTDISFKEGGAINEAIFQEKINNTTETLNERYFSNEKNEEKRVVSTNKQNFSTNSKYDQTNELEYSPFTNKASQENSHSYLLASQSQKKEIIKNEETSNITSCFKETNIQKLNEKIKKDIGVFQKKNSLSKKKDFLIQTNLSPNNQDFIAQFKNLNVSPINNSIEETNKKKVFYSEKKKLVEGENYVFSEKKSLNKKDEICQANFDSFEQYFVSRSEMKRNNTESNLENFNNSLGEPLADPSKCLNFNEEKEENPFNSNTKEYSLETKTQNEKIRN